MTKLRYGIIHYSEDSSKELCIPDGADREDVESAYYWFEDDNDAIYMEVLNLNPTDYWVRLFLL